MNETIQSVLTRVRRRQRLRTALSYGSLGLLAGAVLALVLGVVHLRWSLPLGFALPLCILLAGPVVGSLLGLLRPRRLAVAAQTVDSRGGLKDRTTSALEFLAAATPQVLQSLEIDDAAEHLRSIDLRQVAPLRPPRPLPAALLLASLGATLLFWPVTRPVAAAPAAPLPEIVAEAQSLLADLHALELLAQPTEDPNAAALLKALQDQAEAMQQPGVDEREALAKLSEMQAAVAAYQAQYNDALIDAQLAALGEALTSASELTGAGEALEKSDYEKAADELEAQKDLPKDRRQCKAAGDKLKNVSANMGQCRLGRWAQAADELRQSLSECDAAQYKQATAKMAKETRAHAQKRKFSQCLSGLSDKLDERKQNCNSLARGQKREKSTKPSSNWGLMTSGNIDGPKTDLASKRLWDQVTGNPGEGPLEIEVFHTPEGREQARRSYRDAYAQYRKMSEAVLDSEPIPLGHRALIRRYFELIRPQDPEPAKPGTEAGAAADRPDATDKPR